MLISFDVCMKYIILRYKGKTLCVPDLAHFSSSPSARGNQTFLRTGSSVMRKSGSVACRLPRYQQLHRKKETRK